MLVEAGTRPPSTPPSFPSGDSLPFAPISAMPYLHRPTRIPIVSGRLATDCSVPLRALLFVSLCLYPFANLLPPASFCLSSYVCLLLYVSFCLSPSDCLLLSVSLCLSPSVFILLCVSYCLSSYVCLLLSVTFCLSPSVCVSLFVGMCDRIHVDACVCDPCQCVRLFLSFCVFAFVCAYVYCLVCCWSCVEVSFHLCLCLFVWVFDCLCMSRCVLCQSG